MANSIKEYYKVDAAKYGYRRWFRNPVAKFDHFHTKRVIEDFLNNNKYQNILEIGCGPGTWTEFLIEHSKNITALDISNEMIKIAQSKEVLKDCKFVNIDAINYSNTDKFDLIFSIRVVEYIKNKKKLLEKCYDLLNTNGEIFFITKTKGSIWYGKSKIRKPLRKLFPALFKYEDQELSSEEKENVVNFWQERLFVRDFKKLFYEAGFRDIKIRPVIIRPPLFMRGKAEIPLIPRLLEKPILAILKSVNKIFGSRKLFTIFAESYQISAKKI